MSSKGHLATLTLSDAGGLTSYSAIFDSHLHVDWGLLHRVVARLSANTYAAFTAAEIRVVRYPRVRPSASTPNVYGEPTVAINAFTAPDEDIVYRSGALGAGPLAAMVASTTAAFFEDTIPVEDRNSARGPVCVSLRVNSAAGGTATCVVSLEFDSESNR